MFQVSWIGGWGVPPGTLQRLAERWLPRAEHSFFVPTSGAPAMAANSECVVAWSLGAWHTLNWAAQGGQFRGKVILLSPFVAFGSEYGLGGVCSRTQVRFLKRWLQRDVPGALRDFYSRAGLAIEPAGLPYPMAELMEGLDALELDASPALRQFASKGVPAGWKAVVGARDPLLRADMVMQSLPGCVISGQASHDPQTLLEIFTGDMNAF